MKKLLLTYGCLILPIALAFGQKVNSGFKQKDMRDPQYEYVRGQNSVKAGNCDETLSYYGNTSGIVSTTGNTDWKALMFIDPNELAFFADSSAFGKIRASIADSLFNGTNMYATYDSVYVEVFEGTTISGYSAGNSITNLGTLIYTKNITDEVVQFGITEHDMDSLIYFNKDTTYAIGIRVFQSDPAPCIGVDVGPAKVGKGCWIYTSAGNSFQRIDYVPTSDNNWVIEVCVDGSLVVPNNNLTITSASSNFDGYEIMNLNQVVNQGYSFSTTVKNNGLVMASGVQASLTIDPVNNTDQVSINNILPGASQTGDFPTVFNPFLPGEHSVTYVVTYDSTDFYVSDNEFTSKPFTIDESRYGRVAIGTISPTPEPGLVDVYKGNMMNIYESDTLKYIEFFLMDPVAGAQVQGFCMQWDSAQQAPFGDTLFTDTITITQDMEDYGDTMLYASFLQHKALDPGTYLFGLKEFNGGDYMLPSSTRNYVTGTSYWTGFLAGSGNWINQWVEEDYYYPVIMSFSNTYNTGVSANMNLSKAISIYPNPSSDRVNVAISNEEFKVQSLTIKDLAGRVVGVISNINGSNRFSVNMSDYEVGVYFFEISNGVQTTTKRVIKN